MTDRLTAAARVALDHLARASTALHEAARRDAEYERPKPTPGVKFYCSAVPERTSCWGSNCPPDGCGYPVDERREAEEPPGPRVGPSKEGAGVPRFPFPKHIDAPPPTAPFVTDHKWLDPECHASGCQTLILKAEIEKLRDQRDKYMWQVRDTCARAEAAEAREKRLREALEMIVPLEPTGEEFTYMGPGFALGRIRRAVGIARAALAQGGTDG